MGAGHRDDGVHALGDARIARQQVFDIRLRTVGRTFGVVVTGELEQATRLTTWSASLPNRTTQSADEPTSGPPKRALGTAAMTARAMAIHSAR